MEETVEKKIEETIVTEKPTEREIILAKWIPKTMLGKMIKRNEISSLEEIFSRNIAVLEPEIVDSLVELEEKVVDVKKTTRVVMAGRKFSFRVAVLVGNRDGYLGLGTGKDAEKWPAVRKAARDARLKIVRVVRGTGSWEEQQQHGARHSIPFKVDGKCGSVRITLFPAPRGAGLVAGANIKDVFRLAGITDVWSKTRGATDTKLNFIRAAIDALSRTAKAKATKDIMEKIER